MKRSTGKFDKKNQEIFEGDKVIHAWGWFNWKGETTTYYQIHVITVKPAHMMANGKVHDDGGGVIFNLGNAYNFWSGKEVLKISEEDFKNYNFPTDKHFFFDKGKITAFTDQHFLGLSDEEWEAEKEKRLQAERDYWFGNKN